jgi:hypothetical protein
MFTIIQFAVKNAGCKIDQHRLRIDNWKPGVAIFASGV